MSKSHLVLLNIIMALIGVPIMGMAGNELAKIAGLKSLPVLVVGTGSMYPSLFWSISEGGPEDENKVVIEEYRSTPHLYSRFNGINVAGQTFFKRTIGYGDMVAFKSSKTQEILKSENRDPKSGFIKRVIGLPGDKIELRDGFVYRNDQLIEEPYINTPRSTYGGSAIKDCQAITLETNKYFVLGDNRKVSFDSRFDLGMIDEGDIAYLLPYNEQNIYHSLYRDTARDSKLLGQPSLLPSEFVALVNHKRQSPLTLKPSLNQSTTRRGEKLLSDPNTTYGLKQAISNSGYTNIVLGEFVSYGHFSAQELLENLLYNPGTAKQILSQDYSDLGISAVNREVNGCPTQVIVGHLGGYIPANYDSATIDNWRKLRDNLRDIIPSWEKAIDYGNLDQAKLSQLLTILRRRVSLAEEIVTTIERQAWLSSSQEQRIKNDDTDANQAEELVKELNKE